MNAKLRVASLAALTMLALACNNTSAQSLAPVVDASDSGAWLNAVNGGGCATGNCGGSVMPTSAMGCSGNPGVAADMAMIGIGNGTNCGTGAPLWSGACNGGMSGGLITGMGGGCGIGGGCGTGGLMGGGGGGVMGHLMGGGGGCGAGMMAGGCPCGSCEGGRKARFDIWGEYLYLRARNTEVNYAVPVDGPIAPVLGNGIQIGPTGVIDMDHQPGFRVGMSVCGGICTGLMGQWAHFNSHTTDQIKIGAPDVVRSLVTHPLGDNAASDGLTATADLDIDFDNVDLAFRMPWKKCRSWCAEFLWGVRYGHLNQEFLSTLDFNGTTSVNTDVDFHGVGPRIGMLAQRRIGCRGVYAYSQGDASFLFGEFDAEYMQNNTFGGLVVDSAWTSGRVVPQLDYELGIGMMSPSGRFRLRAGYLINTWFNSVRTNEFINSVQTNDFDDLGDVISFDGLVVRAEMRF